MRVVRDAFHAHELLHNRPIHTGGWNPWKKEGIFTFKASRVF